MANVEKYDDLIIGSGIAGKFAAPAIAVVER
jgi:thioredoxin reductase